MTKEDRKKAFVRVLPSLFSVLIGLIAGWYLLFITKPVDSLGGFGVILAGGLSDGMEGFGFWLYTATPIILTGMSVGFSIKTGLFNIGASGQYTAGACAAILTAIYFPSIPPFLHTLLAVLAGVLAGTLFGALIGILKAYCKVSEVITGIMFNYIVMLLTNLLLKNYAYNSSFNRSADIPSELMLGESLIGKLLPDINISVIFVIAVIAVIIIKFILDKTTLGYELKIIGKNRYAGIYAGINDKVSIISAMAISGALAGLGGALVFMCDYGNHIKIVETVMQQGFDGISVALLGMCSPVGILIAGLFISYITAGGNNLLLFGYTPDVINMIVAIIVYCGALVVPIRVFVEHIIKEKEIKKDKLKNVDACQTGREEADA